jgi:hypothetical protein
MWKYVGKELIHRYHVWIPNSGWEKKQAVLWPKRDNGPCYLKNIEKVLTCSSTCWLQRLTQVLRQEKPPRTVYISYILSVRAFSDHPPHSTFDIRGIRGLSAMRKQQKSKNIFNWIHRDSKMPKDSSEAQTRCLQKIRNVISWISGSNVDPIKKYM